MVCSYWFLANLLFAELSEKSSGKNFLVCPSSHWTIPVTSWYDVSSEEIIHRWCCWIPWVVNNSFTICSLGKLSNLSCSYSAQLFCLFYEFHCEYADMHCNLCKLFQLSTHLYQKNALFMVDCESHIRDSRFRFDVCKFWGTHFFS